MMPLSPCSCLRAFGVSSPHAADVTQYRHLLPAAAHCSPKIGLDATRTAKQQALLVGDWVAQPQGRVCMQAGARMGIFRACRR